ncbi:hypothetical protein [Pseudoroseomonas cervicalis]|uniref:hypothetical protein n=1 Tax=Teichococcus cervicalis TaxID=204525 RepID=UPI0022F197AC|nr:hypothetical protein [Pseudoroseomonas cervicalis]WBV43072.1 hypothetical protein PFY06_00440 [Pseudoroseomonas cervicalis]
MSMPKAARPRPQPASPRLARRHLLGLGAALLAAPPLLGRPARAQDDARRPNLSERRAIEAYLRDRWPSQLQAIRGAARFPVAVELDRDSIFLPGQAEAYGSEDYLGKVVVQPLVQALTRIAADEAGREALRNGLSSISIAYDEATAPASDYPAGLSFEDGALSINWKPYSNVDDIAPRTAALVALLEKEL